MDRRKEILFEPNFGRGFYDSEAQKILCLRRTINDQGKLDLETRQFHLAWPLEVFATISNFVDRCAHDNDPWEIMEHHTQIVDWYRRDPLDTPNYQATLREAMLESQSWNNQAGLHYTYVDSDGRISYPNVYDWKTIANLLETHHLKFNEKSKKKKTALHNLLRIYFNKEKKRRARIDKLWSENVEAKWQLRQTSPEVFAKNQFWPDLDFYPNASVTPKAKR